MIKPFDNISKTQRKKLLKNLESTAICFNTNDNILSSFKNSNMLGIIINGTVEIIRNDYNGNTLIVEKFKQYDVFSSDLYILSNDDKMISSTNSTIVFFDYDMLIHNKRIKNTEYYNQFLLNILEITFFIAKEKNKKIEIISKKGIKEKLLEYFRLNFPNSKKFILPLTITELANYLGVNRSALSRELSSLKKDGIIDIKNKKITLLYKN